MTEKYSLQSADIYRQLTLGNGLEITIRDLTRVYFGDYYLVRLEIICRKEIATDGGDEIASSGTDPAAFRRIVEKMGVSSADIETARDLLVQDFLRNSLSYLSAADFPAKLARFAVRQPKKIIRTFAGE